jgi:hypothetical protein
MPARTELCAGPLICLQSPRFQPWESPAGDSPGKKREIIGRVFLSCAVGALSGPMVVERRCRLKPRAESHNPFGLLTTPKYFVS